MKGILAAGALLAGMGSAALADTPIAGIAGLTVSPDGATVLAAGGNRVIYELDANTMEIEARHWVAVAPVWIRYSADGALVFMRDTQGELIAYDAEGFTEQWRVSPTEDADYATEADHLVFAIRQRREIIIGVLAAATTETVASFNLGEMGVAEIAVSPDGTRIAVLGAGDKLESEERKSPPSELRGLDRELFAQENDQRGARIVMIDVPSGEITTVDSWYSGKNTKGMAFAGEDAIVLAYGLNVARIAPDGTVSLLETGARFHYGAMLSLDQTRLISGSLAQFNIKTLEQAGSREVDLPERLPGWPEYLVSFVELPDGRILAGTSASRIVEISADLNSITGHPVY
ncbi:MAG: hypothetical protein AAGD12_11935 [Pseudomonadota bacterium]